MNTKRTLITFIAIITLFCQAASAQNDESERSSRLKIGIITPSIAYEHAFKKNFSLELGIFANPYYVSSLSDNIQFKYSLNLELRKYLFSKESLSGLYLAGSFENFYLPEIKNSKRLDFEFADQHTYFGGLKFGYQKIFKNGLFINTALGYGAYGSYKYKNSFTPTLDFTFGFTIKSSKLKRRKKELEKLGKL